MKLILICQIDGETKITGGTFNGASGVEIRAGKLEISGGTFTATADSLVVDDNGDGSTTKGAAVAIAQHTTKKPIDVKISGGTFNAVVPVNEANPEGNSAEDLAQITLSITGGTFNTTNGGTKASASEDFTKFVSGGTYTLAPDKDLLKDGYDLTIKSYTSAIFDVITMFTNLFSIYQIYLKKEVVK